MVITFLIVNIYQIVALAVTLGWAYFWLMDPKNPGTLQTKSGIGPAVFKCR
jgi:hypothetical protein